MTRGGWVPMPADAWPVIAEQLPHPWSDEAAAFDLRWQADQRSAPMSRRELAKRWGWTDGEVRTLLRHPERWWDSMKGPAPTSREDLAPPKNGLTQRRPGVTQLDPETTSSERTNLDYQAGLTQPDPETTSPDPATSTRAEITLTLTPTSTPENKLEPLAEARSSACEEPEQVKESKGKAKAKASAARRADFVEAVRVWDEEVVPTARKAGATIGEHPRLDPSKALGKALRQRLDEQGLEAVLLVFRWYAGSSNSRASFLREGGHELSTLTRASKFEEYLGFARAEAASTQAPAKVGRAAHDAPPPDLYVVTDDERAKLREAKAAAKAAIEAERLALEAKQQRLAASLRSPR